MSNVTKYKIYQRDCQIAGTEAATYPVWLKRETQQANVAKELKESLKKATEPLVEDKPKPKRKPRKRAVKKAE